MSATKRAFLDPMICKDCQSCPPADQCPAYAIVKEEEDDFRFVDPMCVGCGKCITNCPYQAIRLV